MTPQNIPRVQQSQLAMGQAPTTTKIRQLPLIQREEIEAIIRNLAKTIRSLIDRLEMSTSGHAVSRKLVEKC